MQDSETEPTYRAAQGAIAHRNFIPLAVAALPAALGVAALSMGIGIGNELAPFASLGIVASWLALALIGGWNAWPHQERGSITVARRGIFIDGELAIPIERIESAVVARVGMHVVVRLRIKGHLLARWLRVPRGLGEAEAHEAIAALGLDAAHVRTSFSLPSRLFRWGPILVFYMYLWFAILPVSVLLGLLCSPHRHGDVGALGLAAMFTSGAAMVAGYWALYFRSRLDVTFGADGIWMKRWGRERLVRWSEVGALEPWPGPMVRGMRAQSEGFDLVLKSGERIAFCTSREWMKRGYVGTRDIVADSLREAMGASRDRAATAVLLPPRAGRSARAWLDELRRAGSGENAGMRTAALDPEQLWRIARDPDAATMDRAAAAAAISGTEGNRTRVALRDAAAMVAEPRLRVAMEAAAEGDDDRLAEALDEIARAR